MVTSELKLASHEGHAADWHKVSTAALQYLSELPSLSPALPNRLSTQLLEDTRARGELKMRAVVQVLLY